MPRRRRTSDSESESTPARRQRQDSSDSDGPAAPSSTDAMVKKMVRFALSSEYSRLPMRRTEIRAKVLGEQGNGKFNVVFEQAQRELRSTFGMEMTELPARDKSTVAQRIAAQKTEKSSSAKSWILTTTLPAAYRSEDILIPTKAPSLYSESTYAGIYTFVIALITLNGGSLAEQKLDRYLARTNADVSTPLDRTDKLLQRLCKDGYLDRKREMDGGDEIIEYILGPRGKVEVGTGAVAGLVRTVYGKDVSGDAPLSQFQRDDINDFEGRLSRSLGTKPREIGEPQTQTHGDEEVNSPPASAPASSRRRTTRHAAQEGSEESEQDSEEAEDSD